ncbi:hypothetical protein Misp01_47180 [Microtetraspora sp. NBRC 13810]|nr:hypothetical protein Misp01_47180 [Microtetraspora sp. NBRC 13810]
MDGLPPGERDHLTQIGQIDVPGHLGDGHALGDQPAVPVQPEDLMTCEDARSDLYPVGTHESAVHEGTD